VNLGSEFCSTSDSRVYELRDRKASDLPSVCPYVHLLGQELPSSKMCYCFLSFSFSYIIQCYLFVLYKIQFKEQKIISAFFMGVCLLIFTLKLV
jgi:hypothetical protein